MESKALRVGDVIALDHREQVHELGAQPGYKGPGLVLEKVKMYRPHSGTKSRRSAEPPEQRRQSTLIRYIGIDKMERIVGAKLVLGWWPKEDTETAELLRRIATTNGNGATVAPPEANPAAPATEVDPAVSAKERRRGSSLEDLRKERDAAIAEAARLAGLLDALAGLSRARMSSTTEAILADWTRDRQKGL